MIRVYQFGEDIAYLHCYNCGKNFELTPEQANDWKSLECPDCGKEDEE